MNTNVAIRLTVAEMVAAYPMLGRVEGLAELVVVRHGESAANAAFARAEAEGLVDAGVHGPDAGVPLTALGCAQAESFGRWLATRPDGAFPEVAFSSPFRRARDTLRIALEQVLGREPPEVVIDERLRDREMGELEMMTRAAIELRYPAEAQRRRSGGEFAYHPPGGESMMDVAARVRGFLADASDRFPARRVLVMAHDAVVLMLRHVIEGLDVTELERIAAAGRVRNVSVTRWVNDGQRLRLERYDA